MKHIAEAKQPRDERHHKGNHTATENQTSRKDIINTPKRLQFPCGFFQPGLKREIDVFAPKNQPYHRQPKKTGKKRERHHPDLMSQVLLHDIKE